MKYLVALLTVLLALGLAGCGTKRVVTETQTPRTTPQTQTPQTTTPPAQPQTTTTTTTPATSEPKVHEIEMVFADGQFKFVPRGLLIQPGDKVVFETISGPPHNAVVFPDRIPEGGQQFMQSSQLLLNPGDKFEVTITTPGTYDYYCLPHQALGMIGTIVVGTPGGPGSTTNTGEPTPEEVLAAPEGKVN
ncbi:MAG: hypothetical protein HY335_04230 [Deinococcus sp.]|nr:hypothetical protein [Deinococcus sp.]